MTIFESIITFLQERNIPYRVVHHQPTFTSEESAAARGEEVKIGGKALLMKINDEFKLFVISAGLKADSKKNKTILQCKKHSLCNQRRIVRSHRPCSRFCSTFW